MTESKQLTQEQINLVSRYVRRMERMVNGMNRSGFPSRELYGAGYEGMCKAARNYHDSKSDFATYMFLYVFKEVNDEIRALRGSEEFSVDDELMVNENGDVVTPLPEASESPHDTYDTEDCVRQLLSRLPPLNRRVVEWYYGLFNHSALSVREIADLEHLSEVKIYKTLHQSEKILRQNPEI